MLMYNSSKWVAIGIRRIGSDMAGDLFCLMSRTITPSEVSPPQMRSEAMSRDGCVRAGLQLAKNFEVGGYAIATPEQFRLAFEDSDIDPFAGLEPLPMQHIDKAVKAERVRRNLEAARKMNELKAAAANAEAAAKVAELERQKQTDAYVKAQDERAQVNQPVPGTMEQSLYSMAQSNIARRCAQCDGLIVRGRCRQCGRTREEGAALRPPPLVVPEAPKVETPTDAAEAGVDHDDIAKRFRNLELD